jgi:hypothetical protein
MLVGSIIPDLIRGGFDLATGGTHPKDKDWGNRVVDGMFDGLKDSIGDVFKKWVDGLGDDTRDVEKQLADFIVTQQKTAIDSKGLEQENFLRNVKPIGRQFEEADYVGEHLVDPRLGRIDDMIKAERDRRPEVAKAQYRSGLAAWSTMLAHKDLNKTPPPPGQGDTTNFKNNPDKERKTTGVMDASFDAVQERNVPVILTARPTIRGLPAEAAANFKGGTFGDLNMPMVSRIHVSRGNDYRAPPKYDLFIESTEQVQLPKEGEQVRTQRDFKWRPESDDDKQFAIEWLSHKDGGGTIPNEGSAQFGAIKVVEEEIAKIKIDDLEIKP